MSGGSRAFDIQISAIDKSAVAFQRADQSIARVDAHARKMSASLGDVARASRFDQISGSFKSIGAQARSVADLLAGSLLPSFTALAGGFGVAGAVSLARGWSTAGAEIKRTSALIGIAESELQSLRGAAYLAGLEASNLDAAWVGFADALQRAKFFGDTQVIAALNALGVTMPGKLTPKTIRKALDEATEGLQQFDTHGRRFISNIVGIGSALQLFGQGAAQVRALEAEWKRLNAEMGPGATHAAEEADRAFKRMELSLKGLGNQLATTFGPAVAGAADVSTFTLANLSAFAQNPIAYARSLIEADTLSLLGQDAEHLKPRGKPSPSIAPHALPPGVPSLFDKRIDTFDTYAPFGRGRGVSQSGADGRVIINLRVESEPGLKTRAVVQDEGQVQTEVFMPTDGP